MIARVHASRRRAWSRFTTREEGSVLPMFALALVPIAAMVGAAVDYSRASGLRAQLQATLDSAPVRRRSSTRLRQSQAALM